MLLCKTVHSYKGEAISVSRALLSRVFILFCPLLQLNAAHREKQKQNVESRAGQHVRGSKNASGSEAETVSCLSDL